MLPTLLTVRETAAAMKLSESAVRSLCDKQLLKVTRIGAGRGKGAIRIYESSVLEYLEGNTRESIIAAQAPRAHGGNGFRILERLGYRWPGGEPASGARRASPGARSDG